MIVNWHYQVVFKISSSNYDCKLALTYARLPVYQGKEFQEGLS
jgi:hypothetical protein